MFENPRRGRQARNFTTNVPKIVDLKSSPEQIFSENCRWVPLCMLPLQIVAKERANIFPQSAQFAKLQNIRHVIHSLRSCFGSLQITYVTCNSQNQQKGIPQMHFVGKAVRAWQNVGCFLRLTLTYFCTYSKMLGALERHLETVCCHRYKGSSKEHGIKLKCWARERLCVGSLS